LSDNDLDPTAVVPLCSGLGDLESAMPPVALFDVARAALRHSDLAAALEADGAEAVLPRLPAWPAFVRVLDRFLEVYGYRGQGEVDPTNADWSEEPLFVLSQVRSMLPLGDEDAPKAQVRQATARRRAFEKTVRRKLPTLRRPLFDSLTDQAQHFTRLRELSKATWVMGMRRARTPYLAMARGLARRGAIAQYDDLRFLVQSEVKSLCAGRAFAEAANVVDERRRTFLRAQRYDVPDHWVGVPKARRRPPPKPSEVLSGLGVSAGSGPVTGMVRIVPSAEAGFARDVARGEILVAPFTDAPWTPLFIPAGAVIVETGGVLSHAATVAREFAVPCVVMVKDATRLLHDGDTVTVDGRTGSVTVVGRG
ncbi:MAG: rifampicin phosphotransferase, partial [Acidimicrobiia bacterium]|nr:rifampicin phosphotransferase [Acidimicrobiia bacterium]